jgi:autotransporter-associated beta strand protein
VANLTVPNAYTVTAPSTIGGGSFFELSGNGVLNAQLSLTNTGFLTLSGALSGPGSLYENGFPGSTTLAGTTPNTFTGGTTIVTGGVTLKKTAGVNALVGSVTIANAGGSFSNLTLGANNQLNGNVDITMVSGTLSFASYVDTVNTLNGNGTVNTGAGLAIHGGSANQSFMGTVQGSGVFIYNGTGTYTLGGASSSFTGTLTAVLGTINLQADFSGAPAQVATGGTLTGNGAVKNVLSASVNGTISPGGLGSIGVLATAAGSFTSFSNGVAYQFDVNNPASSDEIVVGNGALYDLTGSTLNVNVINSVSGNVYTLFSSATGGLSGTFTGLANNSSFTVSGHTFTIKYTANTVTLTEGTASTTTLHWIGSAGSTAWSTASNWLENTAPVSGDNLVFDTSAAGFSTANGFAPVNDLAGLTNLTIDIVDASSSGDFNITGNAFGLRTTVGLGIASTVAVGTGATIANNITLGANTTIDVGLNVLTLSGIVSDAGSFSLTDASNPNSTLNLNNANTYHGGTSLNSGIVQVANNAALGSGNVTFNGGTLANGVAFLTVPNAYTVTAPSTIGGSNFFELSGNGTLNSGFTSTNSGFLTLSGAIGGTGGYTQNSFTGNTIFAGSAANTFTGTTTIVSGTVNLKKTAGVYALTGPTLIYGNLNLSANNQLNGTVPIVLAGGSFNAGTQLDTILSLNGFGTFNPGGGIGVVGGGVQNFTGTVQGSGSLTYMGAGSLTLSGNSSSYTGSLAAQGTLNVSADFSGAPAQVSGGTLSGTGTVKIVSLNSGAVDAGTAGTIGILTTAAGAFASTMSGGTYRVDISSPAASDQLVVGAGATLSLSGSSLTVNVLSSAFNNVYTIITSSTGGISGTFTGLANNATFTAGSRSLRINYSGNAVTLTDVTSGISISPTTLPAGNAGLAYNQNLTVSGGVTPYTTFNISGFSGGTTGLTAASVTTNAGTGTVSISGTPSAGGTVSFTVNVIDSVGASLSKTYTITINPALGIAPTTLPAGDATVTYNQTINVTGGSTPYTTFNVSGFSGGTTGLTASFITTNAGLGTVTLSGTPTSAGTVSFTVNVTDSVGGILTQGYSITINPALAIGPGSLPGGEAGIAYNQTATVTGGTTPYTTFNTSGFSGGTTGLTAAALSTNAGAGTVTLAGTPTAAGTVSFTVNVTDSAGGTLTKTYNVAIAPALAISSTTLPAGDAGVLYNQTLNVTGGVTPYGTFSISGFSGGTTGLTAAAVTANAGTNTVTVNGTPSAAGTFSFTVNVADPAGGTLTQTYNVTVNPALSIAPPTLLSGNIGIFYNQVITVSGGTTPYSTFSVTSFSAGGTGLASPAVNAGAGTFAFGSTPTAAGTASVTVSVTDPAGGSLTKTYSIVINNALAFSPATLPAADVGVLYNRVVSLLGGFTPYTALSVTSFSSGGTGIASPAVSLAAGTITFGSTPSSTGTVTLGVSGTDSMGTTVTGSYTFAVNPTLAIGPASLPVANVATAYNQTITVTGGTTPFSTFNFSAFLGGTTGLTSAALSVNAAAGTITVSGTPTAPGTATFTVNVTDAIGATLTKNYTITVNPALGIGPASLPGAEVGLLYSAVATAAGGTGSLTSLTVPTFNAGGTGLAAPSTNPSTGKITFNSTPTAAGTVTFTANVTDSAGSTSSKSYSITVNPALDLSASSALVTDAGVAYSKTLTITGGAIPLASLNYSGFNAGGTGLTASALTVSLAAGTIKISGTPTAAGTATFTVNATDALGATLSKSVSLVVFPPLTLTAAPLPNAEAGVVYSGIVGLLGGTGAPYTSINVTSYNAGGTGLAAPSGNLFNSGVAFSTAPTAPGIVTFTVKGTDGLGVSVSRTYTITVVPALTLSPATLKAGTIGSLYNQVISVTGGGPRTSFGVTAYSAGGTGIASPATNSSAGTITFNSTPTSGGTVSITVSATDTLGGSVNKTYTITVVPPLVVSPGTPPTGQAGTLYNQVFAVTGGSNSYTSIKITNYVDGGTRVATPTVNLATGKVIFNSTPVNSGTITFTLTVVDASGVVLTKNFSIAIYPLPTSRRLK